MSCERGCFAGKIRFQADHGRSRLAINEIKLLAGSDRSKHVLRIFYKHQLKGPAYHWTLDGKRIRKKDADSILLDSIKKEILYYRNVK